MSLRHKAEFAIEHSKQYLDLDLRNYLNISSSTQSAHAILALHHPLISVRPLLLSCPRQSKGVSSEIASARTNSERGFSTLINRHIEPDEKYRLSLIVPRRENFMNRFGLCRTLLAEGFRIDE